MIKGVLSNRPILSPTVPYAYDKMSRPARPGQVNCSRIYLFKKQRKEVAEHAQRESTVVRRQARVRVHHR